MLQRSVSAPWEGAATLPPMLPPDGIVETLDVFRPYEKSVPTINDGVPAVPLLTGSSPGISVLPGETPVNITTARQSEGSLGVGHTGARNAARSASMAGSDCTCFRAEDELEVQQQLLTG